MINKFPFTVARTDEDAIVSMQHHSLVRARNMPFGMLKAMADAFQKVKVDVIARFKGEFTKEEINQINGGIEIGGGQVGATELVVGVVVDGASVAFFIAVFDGDGDPTPAFVFVDEQIDEFMQKALAILPRSLEPCTN